MSGTLITNSIYNAIQGITNSSGGGTGGSTTTSLVKSGTIAISSFVGNTQINLTTLPTGLAEGLYLVDLNLKLSAGTPANPVATGYYIYVDQTFSPNTYYYPNHTSTPVYMTNYHQTDYFRNPYGSGNTAGTTGFTGNPITTPIIALTGTTITSATGTLYYSVNAVALMNGGVSGGGGSVSGISGLTAGTSISLTGTTTAPTINNTGVTSNVAGSGISVSSGTGAVTITNTGVTSAIAGTGISVSGSTGAVTITNSGIRGIVSGGAGLTASTTSGTTTITNTGVTSITAGTGISVSGTTGAITISGSVGNITGTSTLNGLTNTVGVSTTGGTNTLSLPTNYSNLNSLSSNTGAFNIAECNTFGNIGLSTTGSPIRLVSSVLLNSLDGSGMNIDLGSGNNNTLRNLNLGTDASGNNYNFTNISNLSSTTLNVDGTSTFSGDMTMVGNYNLSVQNISSNGASSTTLNLINPTQYFTGGSITNDDSLMFISRNLIPDVPSACLQYDQLNNAFSQSSTINLSSQWGSSPIVYTDITNNSYQVILGRSDGSQIYLQVKIQGYLTFDTSVTGSLVQGYFVYPTLYVGTGTTFQSIQYNPTTPYNINQYSCVNLTPSQVSSGSTTNTYSCSFTIEDTFNCTGNSSFIGTSPMNIKLNVANVDPSTNGIIKSVKLNSQYQWTTIHA